MYVWGLGSRAELGAIMSSGSYSANQDNKEDFAQGGFGQYTASYNDTQPSQDGMTTQPSVGRFTEKERLGGHNAMFPRKPAKPLLPPPNTSMLVSQDSSSQSQSSSGGIVNLRAGPCAEGKMNKNAAKGKK